jgi:hypothetical protein
VTVGSVLAALGSALDAAGIPWMVAGSVASSTWGEVRSTQDIDLVVVASRTALEWAKATGSERQIRDAAGIVAVQGAALDGAWLRRWAQELGVEDQLARVYPGPA